MRGNYKMLKSIKSFFGVVLLAGSFAPAASPVLQFTLPRAAQRGAEADLVVEGARLSDAKELLFYSPGVTVTSLTPVDAQHVKVHVQVAKDAKVGQYPIRIRTASGVSELRTFYVTPYPVVAEKEPNNDIAHAQPMQFNTTVGGVIEMVGIANTSTSAQRASNALVVFRAKCQRR